MHSLAEQVSRLKLQQLMSFNSKIIMQNILFITRRLWENY